MWIRASRLLPHANQETNGSIECYHGILKTRFLSGRRTIHGRRIDWLIQKLLCSCHSYYWYQNMLKDAGFKKNFNILGLVKSSLERAKKIPDHHVQFCGEQNKNARVKSQSQDKLWYKLRNVDCEWACCDCEWAMKGNICKHQIKVMLVNGLHAYKVVAKTMDMFTEANQDIIGEFFTLHTVFASVILHFP